MLEIWRPSSGGNEKTCNQIRATFTDDGKHIICGSDNQCAYVWPDSEVEGDSEKRDVEVFETHSAMVTTAISAPVQTKQAQALFEDPIYDICNPPPVPQMDPESAETSKQNGTSYKRSASTHVIYVLGMCIVYMR